MFTNSGDEEIAVKALKQGVDDYVLKRKGYQSLATSAKNRLSLSETSTRVPRCLLVCEAEKERDFFTGNERLPYMDTCAGICSLFWY